MLTQTHLTELKKGGRPLGLLLLAVNGRHADVNVVQQLTVKLDAVAAAEKHHDLLASVFFQEREQQQEALVGRYNAVALQP